RMPRPRWRRLVDRAALRLGNFSPGITVGRVQPPAPEIDWKFRVFAHRPCPSAEPRPCLHHEAINMRVHKPPARRDTTAASAHNENLGIAAGHGLFRGDLDRAIHRAVSTISVRPVRANTVAALPETATAFCANVKCPDAAAAVGGGNVLRLGTLTNTLRKC